MILNQTALACTIFSATDGENVLIGNNEDIYEKDQYVWFPGTDGAYGRVCFGTEQAQPQGGTNEAGLFFDLIAITDPKQAPNPEGKPDYPRNKGDMLLELCGTVDEALDLVYQHSPAEYGYIQMFFADKSGASATVMWDWEIGKLVVEKTEGRFLAIGYGKDTVIPMIEKRTVTVDNFRDMLDAAHQGDKTVYSNIYDLNTGDIYIYNQHNYSQNVRYNLFEELKKGKHIIYIPGLFPEQKTGAYDTITFRQFFGPGALELMAVFGVLFTFAACFWLMQIILRNKTLKTSLWSYITGILSSMVGISILILTLLHAPFLMRYGFSLFGFVASILPWALLTLAAVQIIFSVLLWIRKDVRVFSKILYTVIALVTILVFIVMALPAVK
jgi:hypothetical protein